MTAAAPPREALAKLHGHCRLCSKRIVAGEHYVSKLERFGWVHSLCAASWKRLRDENAEVGR